MEVDLQPVGTDAFPRPAQRPAYAPLVTAQDRPILLPPWQQGLAEFCARLPESAQG